MVSGTRVAYLDAWGNRWDGVVVCRSCRCRDVYVQLTRMDTGERVCGVLAIDELVAW